MNIFVTNGKIQLMLASLLISSCASKPLQFSEYSDLDLNPLLGAEARLMVPTKYDSDDFKTYELGASQKFRIRRWPTMNEDAAREQIGLRAAALRQFLAKQIDPYLGEATANSACNIPGQESRKIIDLNGELSLLVQLLSSPNFAIDCYGNSLDRSVDYRQFLYCKKTKSLYEIDLYRPIKDSAPSAPVFHCR
jgi:hypothetical protein